MGVRRMTAAVVVEGGNELGECPVWDPRRSELLWTDIHGRRLHRLEVGWEGPSSWRSTTGCAASPSRSTVTWWRRSQSASPASIATPARCASCTRSRPNSPTTRCNDGRPDRHGGFVFGTMDEQQRPSPAARVVLPLGRRGAVRARSDPASRSANGLCFSPDGLTIYYADSPLGTIWQARYDPESGQLHDAARARRVPTPMSPATPDHPTARRSTRAVASGTHGGARGASPDTRPTACSTRSSTSRCRSRARSIFGGDDLGTLYITTAREHMSPSDPRYELSGALCAVTPGVTGIADTPVRV